MTGPDGRYTDYFYDPNGNVVRTVDNGGRETLTEYDVLNRPVRIIGPVHDALGLTNIRQVTEIQYTPWAMSKRSGPAIAPPPAANL
uniref:RHS repeat domain-containing protein n=1 Tax=Methylocaldum szegediense TaxID=73780 RepID=UPI0037CB6F0E